MPRNSSALLEHKVQELATSRDIGLPTAFPPPEEPRPEAQEATTQQVRAPAGRWAWLQALFEVPQQRQEQQPPPAVVEHRTYERTDSVAAPYMRTNTEKKWLQVYEAQQDKDDQDATEGPPAEP